MNFKKTLYHLLVICEVSLLMAYSFTELRTMQVPLAILSVIVLLQIIEIVQFYFFAYEVLQKATDKIDDAMTLDELIEECTPHMLIKPIFPEETMEQALSWLQLFQWVKKHKTNPVTYTLKGQ